MKAVDNVSLRLNLMVWFRLQAKRFGQVDAGMKVLCDLHPHGSYEGENRLAGEVIRATIHSRYRAQRDRHYPPELALVKHLTVLENIFLLGPNFPPRRTGLRHYDAPL